MNASLTPAVVTLEGYITMPAVVPSRRWNGWELPYFLPSDVRAARPQLEAWAGGLFDDSDVSFRWDDGTDLPVITEAFDDGGVDAVRMVTVDGVEYVTIGWGGWTWARTMPLGEAIAEIVAEYEDIAEEYALAAPADCVAHARNVLTLPGVHVQGGHPVDPESLSAHAFVAVLAASPEAITEALAR